MKPTLLLILLATLLLGAGAQVTLDSITPNVLESSTNAGPFTNQWKWSDPGTYKMSFNLPPATGFEVRNGGTVLFVLRGQECGEIFLLLSNRVWQPTFGTNAYLKPIVPLAPESMTNLIRSLAASGDICRVQGHQWGPQLVDQTRTLTSNPPQYESVQKCGICGVTNLTYIMLPHYRVWTNFNFNVFTQGNDSHP